MTWPWTIHLLPVRRPCNTAVQENLEYHQSDLGNLAFVRRKGQIFVLGDPVTDAADSETLLATFLQQFPKPTF